MEFSDYQTNIKQDKHLENIMPKDSYSISKTGLIIPSSIDKIEPTHRKKRFNISQEAMAIVLAAIITCLGIFANTYYEASLQKSPSNIGLQNLIEQQRLEIYSNDYLTTDEKILKLKSLDELLNTIKNKPSSKSIKRDHNKIIDKKSNKLILANAITLIQSGQLTATELATYIFNDLILVSNKDMSALYKIMSKNNIYIGPLSSNGDAQAISLFKNYLISSSVDQLNGALGYFAFIVFLVLVMLFSGRIAPFRRENEYYLLA